MNWMKQTAKYVLYAMVLSLLLAGGLDLAMITIGRVKSTETNFLIANYVTSMPEELGSILDSGYVAGDNAKIMEEIETASDAVLLGESKSKKVVSKSGNKVELLYEIEGSYINYTLVRAEIKTTGVTKYVDMDVVNYIPPNLRFMPFANQGPELDMYPVYFSGKFRLGV